MNFLGEISRVYENESLGRLARLEDILDKIEFLSLLTLQIVLLDVIQFQFLRFHHDLLRLTDNLTLSLVEQFKASLILGLERGRKENPLEFMLLQGFV